MDAQSMLLLYNYLERFIVQISLLVFHLSSANVLMRLSMMWCWCCYSLELCLIAMKNSSMWYNKLETRFYIKKIFYKFLATHLRQQKVINSNAKRWKNCTKGAKIFKSKYWMHYISKCNRIVSFFTTLLILAWPFIQIRNETTLMLIKYDTHSKPSKIFALSFSYTAIFSATFSLSCFSNLQACIMPTWRVECIRHR